MKSVKLDRIVKDMFVIKVCILILAKDKINLGMQAKRQPLPIRLILHRRGLKTSKNSHKNHLHQAKSKHIDIDLILKEMHDI